MTNILLTYKFRGFKGEVKSHTITSIEIDEEHLEFKIVDTKYPLSVKRDELEWFHIAYDLKLREEVLCPQHNKARW